MKIKIVGSIIIIAVVALALVSYVSAAGISATLVAQSGGVDVVSAPQGTTLQIVSSFTISPSALGTGVVSYRYSADGVTWGPQTTITTYNNWDGTQQSVDFTLTNIGQYVFFVTVTSGFNSATTTYPSTGTFGSDPPSVLPEASSSIVALIVVFAAVGLFVAVKKRNKQ